MSLKAKLVSSVAAFCLVLALLVVGILAVPSATINMGGSITFDAQDVVATVTVTSTGAKTNLNLTGESAIKFDSTTTEATVDRDALNLVFASKTENIVITVTITIDSEEDMTVTPTLPSVAGEGVEIATNEKNGAGSAAPATTAVKTVATDDSIVYTITISMAEGAANNNINATWKAAFVLARVNA